MRDSQGVGCLRNEDFRARGGCGPSPDPPDRRDSLLKEKKEMKKLVFSSFEKPAPGEERCCLESPLTLYFCFLKWGKLSKNKNP